MIKFVELLLYHDIPVLHCTLQLQPGIIRHGYISWFRGYSIQISNTYDGKGDLGSTYQPINLRKLMEFCTTMYSRPFYVDDKDAKACEDEGVRNFRRDIIEGLADTCLNQFGLSLGEGGAGHYRARFWDSEDLYAKWIDETIDYIMEHDV